MDLSGLLDDEELTPLHDADIPRVDLVQAAASGVPRFLLAKQDEAAAGLLDPEFVRDLIAKAGPEPEQRERAVMPNGITVSGSPADIAAFIHKAALNAAAAQVAAEEGAMWPDATPEAFERVAKAKYGAEDRKRMAGKAAMEDGSYPIADRADLSNAIHAVGRGGSDHDAIRRHVIARARALGASSEIPDNWASDGSLKEGSVSKTAAVAKADMGPDLDDGIDRLDPTVSLCAPEDDAPGDPADPGSPAWEAIDAATACKWTSIAVRLKNALCVLSERELLEAASADPEDAENAFDLQDAMCAVDYVISTLAVFAAGEQAEADLGGEAMEAVGKSAAPDLAVIAKALDGEDVARDLFTVESLGAVIAKSGRVLSSVNETHIREAAARLNTVLSSLPKAPSADDGQPVAKEGAAVDGTQTTAAEVAKDSAEEQARDAGPVQAGGTTGLGEPRATGPAGSLPADGPQASLPGDVPGRQVVKADGEKTPMCVVYDQKGRLMGIVAPDDITPVANAEADPEDAADDAQDAAPAAPAADDGDMTPAPAADAGTPADDVAKGATDPAPQGATESTDTRTVLKSIVTEALAELLGAQGPARDVAKQADVAAVMQRLDEVTGRLETVEKQPAMPGVFTHGATPPPGSVPPARPSLRGQDQGAQPVDVAKAADLKRTLYSGTPAEQNAAFTELQQAAIAGLEALHRR